MSYVGLLQTLIVMETANAANTFAKTNAMNDRKPCVIRLVAWDPTAKEHMERMRAQRVAVGWDANHIQTWKERFLDAHKMMYWVVSVLAQPSPETTCAKVLYY